MEQIIIRSIKSALGSQIHNFEIRFEESLDDDIDYYSATFSFEPKQVEGQEYVVTGGKHSMQFDVDGGEAFLIFGEDTQMEVSAANIYAQLYWNEATREA